MTLKGILHNRNRWIALVFAAYVVLIFCLARIYYAMYQDDRENYVFASEILATQRDRFRTMALSELPRLDAQTRVLREAVEAIRLVVVLSHPPFDGGEINLPSGFRIVLGRTVWVSPAGGGAFLTLRVYYPQGQELMNSTLRGGTDWPETRDAYIPIIQREIDRINGETRQLQRRFDTLSERVPDVWGFWDFIYFSTITQATVGYGDIIPNSTTIRMLVIGQVLLGYLVLVVVINLVVKPRQVPPGKEEVVK